MTNPGFTSDSVRCSRSLLIALIVVALADICEAAVEASGVSGWVKTAAERSLSAVFENIPRHEPNDVKERLIRIVADRVLRGYSAGDIEITDDGAIVSLFVSSSSTRWRSALVLPHLSYPVDKWFSSDVEGLEEEICALMDGVPHEAASWGGDDLRMAVASLCEDRVPGWNISLLLRADADAYVIETSFVPEQPLSLAVTSRITSTSVPVMMHSRLKDDLMKGYAPVIGLPVAWLERHADDMAMLAKEVLADEYIVEKGKLAAEVDVKIDSLSQLDIELESRRYSAWVWMAVYAGARDRYPEAGVHFGRKIVPFSNWEVELYGEFIASLGKWELESRLGLGWSPYRHLWLGGEWSSDGSEWWGKISYIPASMRVPYVWARISEHGEKNAAVGFRVTDFLSIELHYDSRYDDEINLRAIVNM